MPSVARSSSATTQAARIQMCANRHGLFAVTYILLACGWHAAAGEFSQISSAHADLQLRAASSNALDLHLTKGMQNVAADVEWSAHYTPCAVDRICTVLGKGPRLLLASLDPETLYSITVVSPVVEKQETLTAYFSTRAQYLPTNVDMQYGLQGWQIAWIPPLQSCSALKFALQVSNASHLLIPATDVPTSETAAFKISLTEKSMVSFSALPQSANGKHVRPIVSCTQVTSGGASLFKQQGPALEVNDLPSMTELGVSHIGSTTANLSWTATGNRVILSVVTASEFLKSQTSAPPLPCCTFECALKGMRSIVTFDTGGHSMLAALRPATAYIVLSSVVSDKGYCSIGPEVSFETKEPSIPAVISVSIVQVDLQPLQLNITAFLEYVPPQGTFLEFDADGPAMLSIRRSFQLFPEFGKDVHRQYVNQDNILESYAGAGFRNYHAIFSASRVITLPGPGGWSARARTSLQETQEQTRWCDWSIAEWYGNLPRPIISKVTVSPFTNNQTLGFFSEPFSASVQVNFPNLTYVNWAVAISLAENGTPSYESLLQSGNFKRMNTGSMSTHVHITVTPNSNAADLSHLLTAYVVDTVSHKVSPSSHAVPLAVPSNHAPWGVMIESFENPSIFIISFNVPSNGILSSANAHCQATVIEDVRCDQYHVPPVRSEAILETRISLSYAHPSKCTSASSGQHCALLNLGTKTALSVTDGKCIRVSLSCDAVGGNQDESAPSQLSPPFHLPMGDFLIETPSVAVSTSCNSGVLAALSAQSCPATALVTFPVPSRGIRWLRGVILRVNGFQICEWDLRHAGDSSNVSMASVSIPFGLHAATYTGTADVSVALVSKDGIVGNFSSVIVPVATEIQRPHLVLESASPNVNSSAFTLGFRISLPWSTGLLENLRNPKTAISCSVVRETSFLTFSTKANFNLSAWGQNQTPQISSDAVSNFSENVPIGTVDASISCQVLFSNVGQTPSSNPVALRFPASPPSSRLVPSLTVLAATSVRTSYVNVSVSFDLASLPSWSEIGTISAFSAVLAECFVQDQPSFMCGTAETGSTILVQWPKGTAGNIGLRIANSLHSVHSSLCWPGFRAGCAGSVGPLATLTVAETASNPDSPRLTFLTAASGNVKVAWDTSPYLTGGVSLSSVRVRVIFSGQWSDVSGSPFTSGQTEVEFQQQDPTQLEVAFTNVLGATSKTQVDIETQKPAALTMVSTEFDTNSGSAVISYISPSTAASAMGAAGNRVRCFAIDDSSGQSLNTTVAFSALEAGRCLLPQLRPDSSVSVYIQLMTCQSSGQSVSCSQIQGSRQQILSQFTVPSRAPDAVSFKIIPGARPFKVAIRNVLTSCEHGDFNCPRGGNDAVWLSARLYAVESTGKLILTFSSNYSLPDNVTQMSDPVQFEVASESMRHGTSRIEISVCSSLGCSQSISHGFDWEADIPVPEVLSFQSISSSSTIFIKHPPDHSVFTRGNVRLLVSWKDRESNMRADSLPWNSTVVNIGCLESGSLHAVALAYVVPSAIPGRIHSSVRAFWGTGAGFALIGDEAIMLLEIPASPPTVFSVRAAGAGGVAVLEVRLHKANSTANMQACQPNENQGFRTASLMEHFKRILQGKVPGRQDESQHLELAVSGTTKLMASHIVASQQPCSPSFVNGTGTCILTISQSACVAKGDTIRVLVRSSSFAEGVSSQSFGVEQFLELEGTDLIGPEISFDYVPQPSLNEPAIHLFPNSSTLSPLSASPKTTTDTFPTAFYVRACSLLFRTGTDLTVNVFQRENIWQMRNPLKPLFRLHGVEQGQRVFALVQLRGTVQSFSLEIDSPLQGLPSIGHITNVTVTERSMAMLAFCSQGARATVIARQLRHGSVISQAGAQGNGIVFLHGLLADCTYSLAVGCGDINYQDFPGNVWVTTCAHSPTITSSSVRSSPKGIQLDISLSSSSQSCTSIIVEGKYSSSDDWQIIDHAPTGSVRWTVDIPFGHASVELRTRCKCPGGISSPGPATIPSELPSSARGLDKSGISDLMELADLAATPLAGSVQTSWNSSAFLQRGVSEFILDICDASCGTSCSGTCLLMSAGNVTTSRGSMLIETFFSRIGYVTARSRFSGAVLARSPSIYLLPSSLSPASIHLSQNSQYPTATIPTVSISHMPYVEVQYAFGHSPSVMNAINTLVIPMSAQSSGSITVHLPAIPIGSSVYVRWHASASQNNEHSNSQHAIESVWSPWIARVRPLPPPPSPTFSATQTQPSTLTVMFAASTQHANISRGGVAIQLCFQKGTFSQPVCKPFGNVQSCSPRVQDNAPVINGLNDPHSVVCGHESGQVSVSTRVPPCSMWVQVADVGFNGQLGEWSNPSAIVHYLTPNLPVPFVVGSFLMQEVLKVEMSGITSEIFGADAIDSYFITLFSNATLSGLCQTFSLPSNPLQSVCESAPCRPPEHAICGASNLNSRVVVVDASSMVSAFIPLSSLPRDVVSLSVASISAGSTSRSAFSGSINPMSIRPEIELAVARLDFSVSVRLSNLQPGMKSLLRVFALSQVDLDSVITIFDKDCGSLTPDCESSHLYSGIPVVAIASQVSSIRPTGEGQSSEPVLISIPPPRPSPLQLRLDDSAILKASWLPPNFQNVTQAASLAALSDSVMQTVREKLRSTDRSVYATVQASIAGPTSPTIPCENLGWTFSGEFLASGGIADLGSPPSGCSVSASIVFHTAGAASLSSVSSIDIPQYWPLTAEVALQQTRFKFSQVHDVLTVQALGLHAVESVNISCSVSNFSLVPGILSPSFNSSPGSVIQTTISSQQFSLIGPKSIIGCTVSAKLFRTTQQSSAVQAIGAVLALSTAAAASSLVNTAHCDLTDIRGSVLGRIVLATGSNSATVVVARWCGDVSQQPPRVSLPTLTAGEFMDLIWHPDGKGAWSARLPATPRPSSHPMRNASEAAGRRVRLDGRENCIFKGETHSSVSEAMSSSLGACQPCSVVAQEGDTFQSIAARFNSDWKRVWELTGGNPNVLDIGSSVRWGNLYESIDGSESRASLSRRLGISEHNIFPVPDSPPSSSGFFCVSGTMQQCRNV